MGQIPLSLEQTEVLNKVIFWLCDIQTNGGQRKLPQTGDVPIAITRSKLESILKSGWYSDADRPVLNGVHLLYKVLSK